MSYHASQYLRPGMRKAAVHSYRPDSQAKAQTQGGEEEGFFGQLGSGTMGVLRQIDDSTQAFARNQLLQLPTDGTRLKEGAFMKGPRNALGEMVFAARNKYEGDNTAYRGDGTTEDNIGLGLTRALQGGAITAAGLGLAQLTTQFGSAADYQEPNQLSL
jgi:hypothetical protein